MAIHQHSSRIIHSIAFCIAMLASSWLHAQFTTVFKFQKDLEVLVQKADGSFWENPWAGGMNACCFGQLDLNGDQQNDLLVFDRSGNRIATWINTPGIGYGYTLSTEYKHCLPSITDWMIMADYNGDGAFDIFTYTTGGIAVYQNNHSSPPSFSLVEPLLYSEYESGSVNLFALPSDYPAIIDLDGDGDLDILNFWTLGTWVDYHQNLSQELYGHRDSLVFRHQIRCWGHFAESESSAHIILNDPNCGSCSKTSHRNAQRHSGSSLFVDDLNQDGKADLLLGDLDYGHMSALYNSASSVNAFMSSVDSIFPSSSQAIDLMSCPAVSPFYESGKGIKQWLVSPSDPDWTKNRDANCVWKYAEDGQGSMQLQTKAFLQETMLDIGSASFAILWDYDKDGLNDLVLGSEGEMDSTWMEFGVRKTHRTSHLELYRNTGTPEESVFSCVSADFAGLQSLKLPHLYPAFADIDADGYDEMLLGHADGSLMLYKQRETSKTIPKFLLLGPLQGISQTEEYPTPVFYDVNADGLMDVVCGNKLGKLSYFQNTGTALQPNYTVLSDFWGGVDVTDPQHPYYGYSVPSLFMYQGDTLLSVGAADGKVHCYHVQASKRSSGFALIDPQLGNIDVGERAGAAVGYINEDAWPDMVSGNLAGGFELFTGSKASAIGMMDTEIPRFQVYPNPSKGSFRLQLSKDITLPCNLRIVDVFGKRVVELVLNRNPGEQEFQLNINSGWYFVVLTCQSGLSHYAKLMVIN